MIYNVNKRKKKQVLNMIFQTNAIEYDFIQKKLLSLLRANFKAYEKWQK